ncbi:MAG: molecular chaperone DnaK, partial [Odoribacter sp.]|nr:molecular chaperone DnaK [Odoribacter sp.]
DIDSIDKALAELNTVWQAASEEMYRSAQNSGGQTTSQPGDDSGRETNRKSGSDEVTDVDFEEVK